MDHTQSASFGWLCARLDRIADLVVGGRQISDDDVESLLGSDGSCAEPLTLDHLKELIEQASSARVPALPERPWKVPLSSGLGDSLVCLFDVAEAAGAAAGHRYIVDRVRYLCELDDEDLKRLKLEDPSASWDSIPKDLSAFRALRMQSERSTEHQLGLRLRPSGWARALADDEQLSRRLYSSLLSALLRKEKRTAQEEQNEKLEEFLAATAHLPKVSEFEDGNDPFDSRCLSGNYDLVFERAEAEKRQLQEHLLRRPAPDASPEVVAELQARTMERRFELLKDSRSRASSASLAIFSLLVKHLVLRGATDLKGEIACDCLDEFAANAYSSTNGEAIGPTDDAATAPSRVYELFCATPCLVKTGCDHSFKVFAFRLWACLRCRDAAGQLESGYGLLLTEKATVSIPLEKRDGTPVFSEPDEDPDESQGAKGSQDQASGAAATAKPKILKREIHRFRRWVSARLFDDEFNHVKPRHWPEYRRRFLNDRRNLVLGGKRYILTGNAMADLDETISEAYSALRTQFQMPELNPGGYIKEVKPTRLLGAFNGTLLPNLLAATEARAISNQLKKEKRQEQMVSRLGMRDPLPAGKTLANSTLYEQVRSGVWRDEQVSAPFDMSRAEVKRYMERLGSSPYEANSGNRVPTLCCDPPEGYEVDIFAALRMGMEFSVIRELLRVNWIFSRIQINGELVNKGGAAKSSDDVPGYGRILLRLSALKPELVDYKPTVNLQHRFIRLMKQHWVQTEIDAREKGDTGLQLHVVWWNMHDLRENYKTLKDESFRSVVGYRFVDGYWTHKLEPSNLVACEKDILNRLATSNDKKIFPFLSSVYGRGKLKSSVFSDVLPLQSEDLKYSPAASKLLERDAALRSIWVRCNEWALRTAGKMLDVLGSSFDELVEEMKDEEVPFYSSTFNYKKSAEHSAKMYRSRKRTAFAVHDKNSDPVWEWMIHPKVFEEILNRFNEYMDAYLEIHEPKWDAVDHVAPGLQHRRALLDKEFDKDGKGLVTAAKEAMEQWTNLIYGVTEANPSLSVDIEKIMDTDVSYQSVCYLKLKVLELNSWSYHQEKQSQIFGGAQREEGESPLAPSVVDEPYVDPREVEVPVPVFHYSKTAVLARGWSEEMLHRLLVSHDYRLLLLPDEGKQNPNNATVVIPARWVWEAEKGWAGKLLGAKKRAKRRAKRPVSKAKGKTKPVSSAGQ